MEKKYLTLARKYRPQQFKDVMGQEAIVTTLKNAIRLKRSAYAYLFSGSRGIGKTTLARLFAKALNCRHLTEETEPCCRCPGCLEIASGRSLDVIEIDGASNRGIDDIRHINETVGYSPSLGNYKIYIIDEVHMLTKEAFNALLKTLEEPPETIKFFFATTEPHKILPTILSRCQRFDLMRIPSPLIVQKLQQIAQDLGREVEKEALHYIAQFSEGSLRDAESFFDQVLCYEEGVITGETISKSLGFLPRDLFFNLDKAVATAHSPFAFELAENLFKMGRDPLYFLEELMEHFRLHLIAKTQNSLESCDYLAEEIKSYYLSSPYHASELFYILELITTSYQKMQKSPFKRASLEMLFLQILQSKTALSPSILIKRLLELEGRLKELPPPEALLNEVSSPVKIESPALKTTPQEAQVVEVPFSFSPPPKEETPKPQVAPVVNLDKKTQSRHDTLLRFASIELEANLEH